MTYIIGDLRLFSRAAAKEIDKTTREYNNYIIQNINSVVNEDDDIFLCGIISEGEITKTVELLNKIKCNITLLCNKKDLIDLDFPKWHTDGFSILKNYNGNDIQVIYLCDNTFLNYITPKENRIIAAPASILGISDKIRGRYLNLSAEALEYYPIRVKDIVQRYEDLVLFESMTELEEKELN